MTTLTNVKEIGTAKLASIALEVADMDGIKRFESPEDAERFAPVDGDFIELSKLAEAYTLCYKGSFEYMVSMREALRRWGKLTNAQAKGVLNCMLAEARRAPKAAPAPAVVPAWEIEDGKADDDRDIDILFDAGNIAEAAMVAAEIAADAPKSVRNGTYTVTLGSDDDYVTLRIKPDFRDKKGTKQMAAFLSGSNNDSDYTGFAFVDGTKFNVWSRFKSNSRIAEALEVLLNGGADEAGMRYATESGKCFCCGRTLTVPASLHLGLGPVCAARGF